MLLAFVNLNTGLREILKSEYTPLPLGWKVRVFHILAQSPM